MHTRIRIHAIGNFFMYYPISCWKRIGRTAISRVPVSDHSEHCCIRHVDKQPPTDIYFSLSNAPWQDSTKQNGNPVFAPGIRFPIHQRESNFCAKGSVLKEGLNSGSRKCLDLQASLMVFSQLPDRCLNPRSQSIRLRWITD